MHTADGKHALNTTQSTSSLQQSEEDKGELQSKTQIKKQMLLLTELGKTIVEFSDKDTAKIPLDATLKAAITDARAMKKSALKRQLQFIGKCLRKRDTTEIKRAVDMILHNRESANEDFKQIEIWREQLLNNTKAALTEYCNLHPQTNVQQLRQLIRRAAQQPTGGKHYTALFRFLRKNQP